MTGRAIKRDFRKLMPARQAELRRVAVAMVRAGKTRIEAAKAVGVTQGGEPAVCRSVGQGGGAIGRGGLRAGGGAVLRAGRKR
jgi:hypothetical protein